MESNEAVSNSSDVEKNEESGENVVENLEKESDAAQNNSSEEPEPSEDYKQKYFYLAAEMDNMRKRFEREKSNLVKFGNERILKDLLEVVDNLDRTMEALGKDADEKVVNILKGVEMIRKQFIGVMENFGLKEIPALGEEFDPHFHEAMGQEQKKDAKDMEITNVYQKGYQLNGRVVRASKVIVAKNS